MDEVIPALAALIRSNIEKVNTALIPFGGLKIKKVHEFEPETLGATSFPCITLGNVTSNKQWVAAPYIIEELFSVKITLYLIHADTEKNAQALRAAVTALGKIFEMRESEVMEVSGKPYQIHYNADVPLSEAELDYAFIGNAFLRAAYFTWNGLVTRCTYSADG